jgi:hypothetical protein
VKETIEYIDRLDIDITETWGKLITTQLTEAMSGIYDIFGKLDELINHINIINKDLGISLDTESVFQVFVQLESAMKIPDYIYMADLIEYEIKPVINGWKRQLISESMLH